MGLDGFVGLGAIFGVVNQNKIVCFCVFETVCSSFVRYET